MFSGIVERLGRIQSLTGVDRPELSLAQSVRVEIATGYPDLELGESVAVNGACLTVAETGQTPGDAHFFVSQETLRRTNLGALAEGSRVNLERALLLTTRLSGHIVQGHVDGLARFESATEIPGGSFDVRFLLAPGLGRYCVEKGSITLNGTSLTLNSVQDLPGGETRVGIMLIPHTWDHTNLSGLKPGDSVNVEVDVIAKYVERLCPTPSSTR